MMLLWFNMVLYDFLLVLILFFSFKDLDSRHRMWFIFDNQIILPEYLIEFDYYLECNQL